MRKFQQLYHNPHVHKLNANVAWGKAKITRWFTGNSIIKRYQTNYDYDAAGNLTTLIRRDQNAVFDRFTYHYLAGTNKLDHISDLANSNLRTDDIDNQGIGNYVYDVNGRLISDAHDDVTKIIWSKSDKVLEVHKPNGVLTIKYNALDQKVSQSTSRNDSIVTEYFVYDPSGNILASYGDTIKIQNFSVSRKFSLHQLTIYGSSRIGLIEVDSLLWKDGSSNVVVSNVFTQKLGLKRYELSNHLGNVQTVVTDRKLVESHSGGQIKAWKADVQSVTDYYPFGMKITERSWNRLVSGAEPYRFGFNGKDFFADWNRQDYGFRIYDPRKARFESVDPLHGKYPWNSTYCFAENDVMRSIDLDGLEKLVVIAVPYNPTQIDGIKIEKKDANFVAFKISFIIEHPDGKIEPVESPSLIMFTSKRYYKDGNELPVNTRINLNWGRYKVKNKNGDLVDAFGNRDVIHINSIGPSHSDATWIHPLATSESAFDLSGDFTNGCFGVSEEKDLSTDYDGRNLYTGPPFSYKFTSEGEEYPDYVTQTPDINENEENARISWRNTYIDFDKIGNIYNKVKGKLQANDNFELEVKPK